MPLRWGPWTWPSGADDRRDYLDDREILGNPRFPLKVCFKGDVDIGIDIDIDVDIDAL